MIEPGAPIPVFTAIETPKEMSAAILGPGLVGSSGYMALTPAELEQVKVLQRRLILYSKVTYETVFAPGKRRHSEFCGVVEMQGERNQIGGGRVPNIRVMPVGLQNNVS
jgi:hypothetical protein